MKSRFRQAGQVPDAEVLDAPATTEMVMNPAFKSRSTTMDPMLADGSRSGGPAARVLATQGSRRATTGGSGATDAGRSPPPLAPDTVNAAAEGQVLYMHGPGGGGSEDAVYANTPTRARAGSAGGAAAGVGDLYATPQKKKRPSGNTKAERAQSSYANVDAMAHDASQPYSNMPNGASSGSAGGYRNVSDGAANSPAAAPEYAVPAPLSAPSFGKRATGRFNNGGGGQKGGGRGQGRKAAAPPATGAAPLVPEAAYAVAELGGPHDSSVDYANVADGDGGVGGNSGSVAPEATYAMAEELQQPPAAAAVTPSVYAVPEAFQPAAAANAATAEPAYAVPEALQPAATTIAATAGKGYTNLDDIVPTATHAIALSAPAPLLTSGNAEISESARSDGVEANDLYASLDI